MELTKVIYFCSSWQDFDWQKLSIAHCATQLNR